MPGRRPTYITGARLSRTRRSTGTGRVQVQHGRYSHLKRRVTLRYVSRTSREPHAPDLSPCSVKCEVADAKRRIRNANHASLPAGVGRGLLLVRHRPDSWFGPQSSAFIAIASSHIGRAPSPAYIARASARPRPRKADVELHVQNNATATATPSRQRRSDDTAPAPHREREFPIGPRSCNHLCVDRLGVERSARDQEGPPERNTEEHRSCSA